MRTYLKNLTLEEIITRLKKGEIIKVRNSEIYTRMVDNIIVRFFPKNKPYINPAIDLNNDNFYFEERFKIKETGFYKTRDGRKVFVSKIYDDCIIGLIDGDEELMNWNLNGFVFDDEREDNQDIIGKWED